MHCLRKGKDSMTIILFPTDFPGLRRPPTLREALDYIQLERSLGPDDVILYKEERKEVLLKGCDETE